MITSLALAALSVPTFFAGVPPASLRLSIRGPATLQEEKEDVELHVLVVSPGGDPLAGARVRLIWQVGGKGAPQPAQVTGKEGSVHFLVPRRAEVSWTAQAPGAVQARSLSRNVKGIADAKGVFRLGPFHPEEQVIVSASTEQSSWNVRRPTSQAVQVPREDIVLTFGPAGKVEGRVTGLPAPKLIREIYLNQKGAKWRSSFGGGVKVDGSFSLEQLTPGQYSRRASLGVMRESATIDFEIRAGEITGGIVLELPPR